MTANQIAYARHLEERRHNVETESQGRRDVESRALTANASWWQAETAMRSQQEGARHNREAEATNWFAALETQRANTEREAIQWWANRAQVEETQRHNRAAETETQRANIANETERRRANISSENISRTANSNNMWRYQRENERELAKIPILQQQADSSAAQATAALKQAATAERRVGYEYSSLAELMRHNLASEAELTRHNAYSEYLTANQQTETQRHNEMMEAAQRYSNFTTFYDASTRRQELSVKQQQADAASLRAKASAAQSAASIFTAAGRVAAGLMIGG